MYHRCHMSSSQPHADSWVSDKGLLWDQRTIGLLSLAGRFFVDKMISLVVLSENEGVWVVFSWEDLKSGPMSPHQMRPEDATARGWAT